MCYSLNPLLSSQNGQPFSVGLAGAYLKTVDCIVELSLDSQTEEVHNIFKFTIKADGQEQKSGGVAWHWPEVIPAQKIRKVIERNFNRPSSTGDKQKPIPLSEIPVGSDNDDPFLFRLEQTERLWYVHLYLEGSSWKEIQSSPPFFETVCDVKGLAKFILSKPRDQIGLEISLDFRKQIIHEFQQDRMPNSSYVEEIKTIYASLDSEDDKRIIIERLYELSYKKDIDFDYTLTGFFELLELELDETVTSWIKKNPHLATLDPTADKANVKLPEFIVKGHELKNYAKSVVEKLKNLRSDKDAYEPLRTSTVLFLAMVFSGVLPFERKEIFRPFLSTLDHYKKSESLEISFLAHYAIGLILLIGDDESTTIKVGRNLLHVAKGLALLASIGHDKNILPIFEAVKQFKKVADESQLTREEWFDLAYAFREQAIRASKGALFKSYDELLNKIEHSPDTASLNDLRITSLPNPYFVQGVLAAAKKVLKDFPAHAVDALRVLKRLYLLNVDNHPSYAIPENRAGDGKRTPICVEIFTIIYKSTFHSDHSVRNEAARLLKEISTKGASLVFPQPFSFDDFLPRSKHEHQLFDSVLKMPNYSWLQEMQAWKDGFLRGFTPVDEEFYYPLQVLADNSNKGAGSSEELFKVIRNFTQDESKPAVSVLVLNGAPGSGKTLSTRKFVSGAWERETACDTSGYLPLFVSLGRVKDSISEILKDIFPTARLGDLKKRKIIVFADGYDEAVGGKDFQGAQATNIYRDNQFKSWPNLRLLITSRPNSIQTPNLILYGNTLQHFVPDNGGKAVLNTINPVETDSFVEAWIKMRQIDTETANKIRIWIEKLKKEFLKDQSTLVHADGVSRQSMLVTPFFLTALLYMIPHLPDDRLKKSNPISITKELICQNVHRESLRTKLDPIFILDLAITVAKIMKDGKTTVLQISDTEVIGKIKTNLVELSERVQQFIVRLPTTEQIVLKSHNPSDENFRIAFEALYLYRAGSGQIEFFHPTFVQNYLVQVQSDLKSSYIPCVKQLREMANGNELFPAFLSINTPEKKYRSRSKGAFLS